MTEEYFDKYKQFIFKAKTAQAERLTGKDLATYAVDAKESGVGGDQMGARRPKEVVAARLRVACRNAQQH